VNITREDVAEEEPTAERDRSVAICSKTGPDGLAPAVLPKSRWASKPFDPAFLFVGYTGFVSTKVTIALSSGHAVWVRKRAPEEGLSLSMFIARILEREIASHRYWQACDEWKNRDRDLGVSLDAAQRFTRDQAHKR
jgi:hypothetical protein